MHKRIFFYICEAVLRNTIQNVNPECTLGAFSISCNHDNME